MYDQTKIKGKNKMLCWDKHILMVSLITRQYDIQGISMIYYESKNQF